MYFLDREGGVRTLRHLYVYATAELSVGPISSTQPIPIQQTTDPTQPNPSQSKNFGPTNQPNPQPITQSNSIQPITNLRAQERQF